MREKMLRKKILPPLPPQKSNGPPLKAHIHDVTLHSTLTWQHVMTKPHCTGPHEPSVGSKTTYFTL